MNTSLNRAAWLGDQASHARKLMLGSVIVCGLLLALASSGCITRAKAKAQARAAYVAGQQDMMRRMNMVHNPTVTINGEVRNPIVPWNEELTLAKALVAADYYGKTDPAEVIIVRGGQATRVDLKQLLNGQDVPLSPGDIVELRRQAR
jgi:hypothetical protein